MNLPGDTPSRLAVVLAVALIVTSVWATSASNLPFSGYNRAWDGTSELRQEAGVSASTIVAPRMSAYDDASPPTTISFVLSPDEAYADDEAARLERFVRAGGTLVVAEDFGPHTNPLLRRVGVSTRVDGRLVRSERDYYRSPNLTVATNVRESPLTDGVDRLTLNRGTVLRPNGARVLVETSQFAYVDANENATLDAGESMRRYPVVTAERVGDGRVVVISDPSLFINGMLDRTDNRRFARALFSTHETAVLDYSHANQLPPLVDATLSLQQSSLLQSIVGAVLLGLVFLLSRRASRRRTSWPVADDSAQFARERARHGLRSEASERASRSDTQRTVGIIGDETRRGDTKTDDREGGGE